MVRSDDEFDPAEEEIAAVKTGVRAGRKTRSLGAAERSRPPRANFSIMFGMFFYSGWLRYVVNSSATTVAEFRKQEIF